MASSFLTDFGWRPEQDQAFAPYVTRGCVPARVASESQHLYSLYTEQGEVLARVSGKFRHTARGRQDFPAVGDWVAASLLPGGEAVIHGVLPRHSRFSRKVAGETTEEQVVAANVDTIFLVSALTNEFNPRRLERYLVMAWESGATPVIVLNKTHLCPDVEAKAAELGLLAAGVPVHPVSGATGQGLDALLRYLEVGRTVAFLGSSGVGKSTLITGSVARRYRRPEKSAAPMTGGATPPPGANLYACPGAGWSSTPLACVSCSSGRRRRGWTRPSLTWLGWPNGVGSATAAMLRSPGAPSGRPWRTAPWIPPATRAISSSKRSWPTWNGGRTKGPSLRRRRNGSASTWRHVGGATGEVVDSAAIAQPGDPSRTCLGRPWLIPLTGPAARPRSPRLTARPGPAQARGCSGRPRRAPAPPGRVRRPHGARTDRG